MSVRQQEYTLLIKEILGPRDGSSEIMNQDPRSEYITGILEPKDYDRPGDDFGNSDIGTYISQEDGEEDSSEQSDDFDIQPKYFDPRALPKSLGLSFVIESLEKPLIDICATWARYPKSGKSWVRKLDRCILNDTDASKKNSWHPSQGVRIVLLTTNLKQNVWHVSVYLVNETKFKKPLTTPDLIFQPQIRVKVHEGVSIIPVDKRLTGSEEKQLDLLYDKLQGYARGHLCGATWKDIDSERPVLGGNEKNILVPSDVTALPDQDKKKFINPDVRTEYLPAYSVNQSTVEVTDIVGMKEEDTSAEVLAEKWDFSELSGSLNKIPDQYNKWIEIQKNQTTALPKNHQEVAGDNLKNCDISCKRIIEGINLLNDENVRLAFCFMNKVMNMQSLWARQKHLVWRPFQLAFILMCIPAIEDKKHVDREICDLLWYPTAGGKTEAYLGLMTFTLALRRLKRKKEESSSAGTAVISRYTLRLLTIQQFRRALSAITVCELLRIKNWTPNGLTQKPSDLWGLARFSIGLWLGGDVTPNNVVDHKGYNIERKASTRYAGAISILKYAHKKTNRPGEIVSSKGEPAQVIKCPCCSAILAVPDAGLAGNEHEIFWIVKSEQKPKITPAELDYVDFKIISVDVNSLPNDGYYSIGIKFRSSRGKIDENLVWEWWKLRVKKRINGILICTAPTRPGYFVKTTSDVYRKPVDFEIHCPNPNCELNSVEWFENSTESKDSKFYSNPLEPFSLPTKENFSHGMPIPAYTTDSQVYHRCPSVIIATVDKFARLPFEPKAGSIFGNVNSYDDVWGYHRGSVPPDMGDSGKKGNTISVPSFIPPELFIQDELHLIEGPLGSMSGLYETALDVLSQRVSGSQKIIPKYIASTATTRQASTQIRCLFNRKFQQFPSSGISAHDNFFSKATEGHPLDDKGPGRLYVGVCAPGKGPQTPTVRIWSSLLQEAERIRLAGSGKVEGELDYFWTVVGYFNAIRELAAARSLYRQDIPERIKQTAGANPRTIDELNLVELYSNIDSSRIPAILEQLESPGPGIDAVMATSMFGTGVDIDRLSLMIVHGQPKTTASYIQATGRVGRKKGALVVTFLRSTRPRDLDHYEFFTGYHRALHRYVEPVTVSPFSPGACDRALGPVAVSILRNGISVDNIPIRPDWASEFEYWKGVNGISGSRNMSSLRNSPELSAIAETVEDRSQQQPKNRRRTKERIKRNLNSDFDKWENIARIEPSLFYYEPAFNYLPNNPVVLGDEQHKKHKKRMVYERTPQSMRDVESTTRFDG